MKTNEQKIKYNKYINDYRHKVSFGGLREKVIKRDNSKCTNCKMTRVAHQKNFGKDITVDHVNGNRDTNTMKNLVTLCLTCHGSKDGQRADYSKRDLKGEKHGRSKLTEKEVVEIRKRVASGETQVSIAAEFGVTVTPIYLLVHHKTWKHI